MDALIKDENGQPNRTGREWCLLPVTCHELYHSGLASYAFDRHGTVTGLKGVVHEGAFALRHNVNPLKLANDGFARLNPNTRDPRFDVVFSSGAGVQLKDTVSPSGARSTALRSPHYDCPVLGTPETVGAVAKYGGKIASSGVSTAHNEAVAARAAGSSGASWAVTGRNITTGAAVGAACGIGIALYNAYERHRRGEESWQQIYDEAIRKGLTGAAFGAVGAAAGTAVAAMLPAGNAAIFGGMIAAVAVALLLSKVTDEQWAALVGGCATFVTAETATCLIPSSGGITPSSD